MPPSFSKRHIYTDESVFEHIDQVAISIAQSEVQTFTDLVRVLTAGARSDVDKGKFNSKNYCLKTREVIIS